MHALREGKFSISIPHGKYFNIHQRQRTTSKYVMRLPVTVNFMPVMMDRLIKDNPAIS